MKPGSSGCCSAERGWAALCGLVALLLLGACGSWHDGSEGVIRPRDAQARAAPGPELPQEGDAWSSVTLPDWRADAAPAWYRVPFELRQPGRQTLAVYLPYFYGGGTLVLNGQPVEHIASRSSGHSVRWERPHLVPLPQALLRDGGNVLLIRAETSALASRTSLAPLQIGPVTTLQRTFERRHFVVSVLPQFTVIACVIAAVIMAYIYWRRRSEVLYGLFGLAALMWGARTLTFVIESLPPGWWPVWRGVYFASTGGFIVVLLLFAMRMSGAAYPRIERAAFGYWLVGPLVYLLSRNDNWLSLYWIGGMIPVGIGVGAFAVLGAVRRRTAAHVALAVAFIVAVACGVHDYLLANAGAALDALLPGWAEQRLFLLHHGANFVLLVMGAILAGRFVNALGQAEEANRTLEARVAEREQELSTTYRSVAELQRVQAAAEERALIVRDLHDGLGSVLFTSLLRAERGDLSDEGIVQVLRDCIAEMRLVIEAMPPDEREFANVFGNFRFRWQQLMQAQGIRSEWQAEALVEGAPVVPQQALQVLRILQEALTNAMKHARASVVRVTAERSEVGWRFIVADDGVGLAGGEGPPAGRGIDNMRRRATRLGGELQVRSGAGSGTAIELSFPAAPARSRSG